MRGGASGELYTERLFAATPLRAQSSVPLLLSGGVTATFEVRCPPRRRGVLMDLSEAVAAHIRWKIRLLQCIHGQAEVPNAIEVAQDDVCELGKWLMGEGMEYASLASFHDTKRSHATFHLRAAEVVTAVERGEKGQAEAMLAADTPYGIASDAVVLALTKFRAEVRKAGKAL